VIVGLYLVIALEATGSRKRSALVGGMCLSLAAVFATVLLIEPVRRFFALSAPTAGVLLTAAVAGLLAIGALALAGFSLTAGRGELAGGEG
jgi:hypothetical protein